MKPEFLVVEDDPLTARGMAFAVESVGATAAVTGTVIDACAVIATHTHLSGAVIDVVLPDGSGMDVLRLLRSQPEFVPALVVTGLCERDLPYQAFVLRASHVCKPIGLEAVAEFARRALLSSAGRERTLQAVDRYVLRYRLSRRHGLVILDALDGLKRAQSAVRLAVSENTLKRYVQTILERTGQDDLRDVARVLREWIDGDADLCLLG